MKSIGLDIGTTTICGILMDAASGELIKKITLPNDTAMEGKESYEKLQNPEKIEEKCRRIVAELSEGAEDLVSLGVTGQMHGILYVSQDGCAVSPLMTWQDGRGDQPYRDGKSYAKVLSEITGYRLATGFGGVTHYHHTVTQTIPEKAAAFCTIPDYIAMKLAGQKAPALHSSMAASLGMYDMAENRFDTEKIEAAGMDPAYFPKVLTEEKSIGLWNGKILVSPAFGDNQASFLGSVGSGSNVLVNVGTGSQVSVLGNSLKSFPSLECRPFMEGKYLYVGSSLCGGYSYSLLKGFFEEVFRMCGQNEIPELYSYMNAAGRKAKEAGNPELLVDTRFRGSRANPALRGKIEQISPDNLTPGALVFGILRGICQELLDFYKEYEDQDNQAQNYSCITGSGNGIRQNPLLQDIFQEDFQKELVIPACAEEASYGSAMFSLYAAGIKKELKELQKIHNGR